MGSGRERRWPDSGELGAVAAWCVTEECNLLPGRSRIVSGRSGGHSYALDVTTGKARRWADLGPARKHATVLPGVS
ncbi:hypothetical protein [Nonomuraea glycinis]|uniref:hypothetical protein n=1 Tax=Nonomuraea glycinis TaxID=2047744 RepID=UPI0033AC8C98